jgi:hypothetical protein
MRAVTQPGPAKGERDRIVKRDKSGPFPGMDPYLEDPYFFHGFHNSLILRIHDALNADLPDGYSAYIEQRLAIVPVDRDIYGDVMVTKTPAAIAMQRGAAAVAERGQPDAIVGALSAEAFDWYIEIRTARRQRPVVCIIEVLSPANKEAGSEGRREYCLRQQEILRSQTHLVEIDLLRAGSHTVGAPIGTLPRRGETWDYIVCLSRSTDRTRFECWFSKLSTPLPEIRVPLLGDAPDIILDLQAAVHKAYTAGPYFTDIDYDAPLVDALPADRTAWANERIAAWKRASGRS